MDTTNCWAVERKKERNAASRRDSAATGGASGSDLAWQQKQQFKAKALRRRLPTDAREGTRARELTEVA